MNIKWMWIGISIIITAMWSGISIEHYSNSQKEIAFAKAGLQQCVQPGKIRDEIVWKKECK